MAMVKDVSSIALKPRQLDGDVTGSRTSPIMASSISRKLRNHSHAAE